MQRINLQTDLQLVRLRERFFFNLDSAVGIVARAIKLMKIYEKVEKFFESSTHPYGEKNFSTFVCRFRRLIARSRFQRRNLGSEAYRIT